MERVIKQSQMEREIREYIYWKRPMHVLQSSLISSTFLSHQKKDRQAGYLLHGEKKDYETGREVDNGHTTSWDRMRWKWVFGAS
jgi:hypothetical protein